MLTRAQNVSEHGHVLLAALMVIVMLLLMSMALLQLAAQDAPSISAIIEQTQAQHLAEGAGDLLVTWFHDPSTAPASLAPLLTKRQDTEAGPSFFDAAGRSQFAGTADRPDILLDASDDRDASLLDGSISGFNGALSELGRLERLKMYAPIQPGLLGTVEVTASVRGRRSLASTIRLQLGAVNLPAIRAAVEIGQGLGTPKPGGGSAILTHWGDVRVMGDFVINRINDLVVKRGSASVTGQSYDPTTMPATMMEDRWVDYWIGGDVSLLAPSGTDAQGFPTNVYAHQQPTPGVRLDRWDYEVLKKTALRHGTYFRLDRDGRLHSLGAAESDPGRLPAEVLASSAVGQSHGLVFIDTLDGQAPNIDNLGTLTLESEYVEALLVVQAHVVLKPSAGGRTVTVLSPPPEGSSALSGRIPVTLPDIHLNGLLYAAGSVTIERQSRIYGALVAGGTIVTSAVLELWYNADFGRGLFRGVPVVYRAPSTWQVKY